MFMRSIQILFIFLAPLLLGDFVVSAQQARGIVLTGKILTLEELSPIEGATIQVKGTRNVSGTLYDGGYAIEIQPTDSMLVFSHEGYETQEVEITANRIEYNVKLKCKKGITCNANPFSFFPSGMAVDKPQIKPALAFIIIALPVFAVNDGRALLFHKG